MWEDKTHPGFWVAKPKSCVSYKLCVYGHVDPILMRNVFTGLKLGHSGPEGILSTTR